MAMDETVEAGSIADLSVAELLQGLLGSGSRRVVDVGPGSIRVVQAQCGGDKLIVTTFDYSQERGSIGLMEAEQLVAAIRLARQGGGALVFLMNTSGIRVTDSTAGIASLRRVLREAEDARLQGIRMLAMIVRHAFGGASILAALCEKRVIHDGCLYAMSGPKLIEQVAGADRFDAGDRRGVRDLLGGAARASQSDDFVYVDGTLSAYRRALIDWLRRPAPAPISLSELRASGAALEARLGRKIPEAEAIARTDGLLQEGENEVLDAIHPSGSCLLRVSNVIVAKARSARSVRVLALIAREGCGFGDALALSRELLGSGTRDEPYKRSVLIVDSESHAATPVDEGLVLSEALAHLALVVRWLHHAGQRVDVVVTGLGGGGIQGALGSAASSVAMGFAGRLRVLPEVAMRALQKAEDVEAGSISMAIAVGAVDFEFHPVRRQGAADVV
jgi:Malonate decarboxylase gamma subunit (MdcE)